MISEIRRHLRATPFEPFTIVTSGGSRFVVPSADHAGINPGGSRVLVWFDDDSSVTVPGQHVVALERGSPQADTGGGGAP